MVKWLHPYCFLKQLCDTVKCPDFDDKYNHKCCDNCGSFVLDVNYDFYCNKHELPDEFDFISCGYFCKDYKKKKIKNELGVFD